MNNSQAKLTKILCVDDTQDLRENMNIILSQEGYEVIEATNGADAYEKFTNTLPDLIICDIDMPIMNGYDFFKKIHKDHQESLSNIPFIFLTGLNHKDNHLEGIRLGVDDYMLKPIDFDILLSTIKAKLSKTGERKDLLQDKISSLCDSFVNLIPQEINYPLQDILELSNSLKSDLFKANDYDNLNKIHNNYATKIYMSALKLRSQIVKVFDKDKVFNIVSNLTNYYKINNLVNKIITSVDDNNIIFEVRECLGEIAIEDRIFIENITKYIMQHKQAQAKNIRVSVFKDIRGNIIISVVSKLCLPVFSNVLERFIASHNGDFNVKTEDDDVYHIITLPNYLIK
jgi:DNA-binding response OmpR family regulator